jgi:hypothetical protein
LVNYPEKLTRPLRHFLSTVPGKKSAGFPNRHQPGDDFEKALNELGKAEADLRGIIDIIPALGWCNRLEGSVEFMRVSHGKSMRVLPSQEAHEIIGQPHWSANLPQADLIISSTPQASW